MTSAGMWRRGTIDEGGGGGVELARHARRDHSEGQHASTPERQRRIASLVTETPIPRVLLVPRRANHGSLAVVMGTKLALGRAGYRIDRRARVAGPSVTPSSAARPKLSAPRVDLGAVEACSTIRTRPKAWGPCRRAGPIVAYRQRQRRGKMRSKCLARVV